MVPVTSYVWGVTLPHSLPFHKWAQLLPSFLRGHILFLPLLAALRSLTKDTETAISSGIKAALLTLQGSMLYWCPIHSSLSL